jgi:hypothetical protein
MNPDNDEETKKKIANANAEARNASRRTRENHERGEDRDEKPNEPEAR